MRLDRTSLGGGILLAVGFLWEPFGGTPQERTWMFLWVLLYFLLTARFERTRRVWDRLISEGGWVRCQLDGTWKTWWSQWSFQEGVRGGTTLLFAWFLFGPFDFHPTIWSTMYPEWTAPNTWIEAIGQTGWEEPWGIWWSCMFFQGISFFFWSIFWAQVSLFWAVWLGGQRKAEERIPWDLWMVFPLGLELQL